MKGVGARPVQPVGPELQPEASLNIRPEAPRACFPLPIPMTHNAAHGGSTKKDGYNMGRKYFIGTESAESCAQVPTPLPFPPLCLVESQAENDRLTSCLSCSLADSLLTRVHPTSRNNPTCIL